MNIISQLKKNCKVGCLALSISGILVCTASANNAFKGDALYQQNNFEQALTAYIAAAEMGSPHVYYQLGAMYYKGQGTKPNYLSALLWFSLAAEYQFSDSEKIFNQLFDNIDEKDKTNIHTLIDDFKQKYGKQKIHDKYLPELITANLEKTVTFGGEGSYETENDASDKLFGITSSNKLTDDEFDDFNDLDDADPFAIFDDLDAVDEENEDENQTEGGGALIQDAPEKKNPLDLPYLAVIDYDVAPDGSIRNINKIYSEGRAGNIKTAMYDYSLLTLGKPTFDGKRVNFINRGYIGINRYDLMEIRGKHKDIYDWVRRSVRKLEKSDSSHDKYKLAMLMQYYPWFPQEKGQSVSLLKELAELGHVNSQYEYGLYLYREQTDVAEAIKWLSLAGQFGMADAQYRLARILQESPWVVTDERKALFWYENAAKKGHSAAILKTAELKLLANDESLRNQAEAIDILNNIEQVQSKNPDYNYLVAVSHLDGKFRDFTKVVKYLRFAISRGRTLNWDVSKWEEQLSQWTTGKVFINDND